MMSHVVAERHPEKYIKIKSSSYIEETIKYWARGDWVVVAEESSSTLKLNFEYNLVLLQQVFR